MGRYLLEWIENGQFFVDYRDYPEEGDKGAVTQFDPWTGEITGIQPVIWIHQGSGLVWDQGRVDFPPSDSDYYQGVDFPPSDSDYYQGSELVWDQGCVDFPPSDSDYSRRWRWIGEVELDVFHKLCLLVESGVTLDRIWAEYGEVPLEQIGAEYGE